MVNCWLPEPPNDSTCDDEVQSIDDIIIPGTDTSDTDEEVAYNGYEPLPLGPTEADNGLISDSDEENIQNIELAPSTSESFPPIVSVERTLIREVWSSPTPTCADIEMDSVKANEVKMAMANFTLPSSSIPEWAASIPEDQWKEQLINRIQHLQENKK